LGADSLSGGSGIMSFFPDLYFGWTFVACLVVVLGIASWTDLRYLRVPNWLTVSALALGLVLNLIRGCWMGAIGQSAWVLPAGIVWGVLDALLFSLAGFLFAFGLFFGMWILGVCGAGDVKLFAAVGAWLGPRLAFWMLAASTGIVMLVVLARMGLALLRGQPIAPRGKGSPRTGKPGRNRILGYSLPLMLSALVVLPVALQSDLGLRLGIYFRGSSGEAPANDR
jgi:prepilin peptidase CpaA